MSLHRLVITMIFTGALGLPQAAAAQAPCPDARLTPKAAGSAVARPATICEINRMRSFYGLRSVRFDRKLRTAASRHARDMVRRDYFSHRSLDGRTLVDRVRAAGGLEATAARPAGTRRELGENLAWRRGEQSTPGAIVLWWLLSDKHREVLLDPQWRYVGVGIAHGAPVPIDEPAATYAAVFAT